MRVSSRGLLISAFIVGNAFAFLLAPFPLIPVDRSAANALAEQIVSLLPGIECEEVALHFGKRSAAEALRFHAPGFSLHDHRPTGRVTKEMPQAAPAHIFGSVNADLRARL